MSPGSQQRLILRGASHLVAAPLALPGGGLLGMVTADVLSLEAMGERLLDRVGAGAIEAAAALAAPYLAALPRHAVAPEPGDPLLPVIGATMAAAVRMLRAFAAEDETLLIHGETGTGKSRLARWCHAGSPRRAKPFEVLDLLGVPEDMQMPELFGWRRGAFTGAVRDHDGAIARAAGGTLFIDEVDKLSLKAQAGLLRLIEERRYRPLGESGGELTADVRFIVGTNLDLAGAVREGRFREDLYYRINVLPISLPPLRERRDEIPGWATFLLERRHRERSGAGRCVLSADAALTLQARPWPGNLRELDNVLRRAYMLASLDAEDEGVTVEGRHAVAALGLGADAAPAASALGLDGPLAALVRRIVEASPPIALDDLDLGSAMLGLLLAEAVTLTGSRERAFEVLGRGDLVRNRNHHRALRRDCGRAVALLERLGQPPPATLVALSDRDEGSGRWLSRRLRPRAGWRWTRWGAGGCSPTPRNVPKTSARRRPAPTRHPTPAPGRARGRWAHPRPPPIRWRGWRRCSVQAPHPTESAR